MGNSSKHSTNLEAVNGALVHWQAAFGLAAVLTINPGENLIEKMVFDVDFSGVSLLRITLELAEANPGLADAVFDHRTYAPPGTPVVEKKPGEKRYI